MLNDCNTTALIASTFVDVLLMCQTIKAAEYSQDMCTMESLSNKLQLQLMPFFIEKNVSKLHFQIKYIFSVYGYHIPRGGGIYSFYLYFQMETRATNITLARSTQKPSCVPALQVRCRDQLRRCFFPRNCTFLSKAVERIGALIS